MHSEGYVGPEQYIMISGKDRSVQYVENLRTRYLNGEILSETELNHLRNILGKEGMQDLLLAKSMSGKQPLNQQEKAELNEWKKEVAEHIERHFN